MNAAKLKSTTPARILMLGYPGGGKTGSLACLANAGFKLRILAFDKMANMQPLFEFCTLEGLRNIDIVAFEDTMKAGPDGMVADGIPTAFTNALKLMDHWSYEDDGKVVDLGRPSTDWGLDTIVTVDSITSLGHACMNRARKLMNKTPRNTTDATWGLAMSEQENFIKRLNSSSNKHHVIVTSHLKMIGPKEKRKGDDPLTEQIKEQIAELIATRHFPSALGWQLPQSIAGEFATTLLVEQEVKGNKVKRVIRHLPRPEVDLKLPTKDLELPNALPITDGMLTIFRALGVPEPRKGVYDSVANLAKEKSNGKL